MAVSSTDVRPRKVMRDRTMRRTRASLRSGVSVDEARTMAERAVDRLTWSRSKASSGLPDLPAASPPQVLSQALTTLPPSP